MGTVLWPRTLENYRKWTTKFGRLTKRPKFQRQRLLTKQRKFSGCARCDGNKKNVRGDPPFGTRDTYRKPCIVTSPLYFPQSLVHGVSTVRSPLRSSGQGVGREPEKKSPPPPRAGPWRACARARALAWPTAREARGRLRSRKPTCLLVLCCCCPLKGPKSKKQ